jgi:hypothetical protein
MSGYRLCDIAGEVFIDRRWGVFRQHGMHSSMHRRGGAGVCSTATVSEPSSLITSAPART